jgi:hypothetical protein
MKTTLIAIAVVMLVGCKQQQHDTSVASAPAQPKQIEATTNMSPEQLGTLGAQIHKEPSRANELLSAHGLDTQSFEKAIRKITQDPVASKRYAAAYKAAS